MPFESRARRFLKDQGKLSKPKPRCELMVATIQFLLDNNAIGHKNLIRTDDIVEHIQKIKPKLTRGQWETDILGPLRDNEIWLGSKPGGDGGIFIIKDKDDLAIVKATYCKKVITMIKRYQILKRLGEEL